MDNQMHTTTLGIPVLQNTKNQKLVQMKRYQPFTDQALSVASLGGEFTEIAGNKGGILISTVSKDMSAQYGRVLYKMPIITQAGYQRLLIEVPVAELSKALRGMQERGERVEHVFDY